MDVILHTVEMHVSSISWQHFCFIHIKSFLRLFSILIEKIEGVGLLNATFFLLCFALFLLNYKQTLFLQIQKRLQILVYCVYYMFACVLHFCMIN